MKQNEYSIRINVNKKTIYVNEQKMTLENLKRMALRSAVHKKAYEMAMDLGIIK